MDKKWPIVAAIVSFVILALFVAQGNIGAGFSVLIILAVFVGLPVFGLILLFRSLRPKEKKPDEPVDPQDDAARKFKAISLWTHFGVIALAAILASSSSARGGAWTGAWYSLVAIFFLDLLGALVFFIIGRTNFAKVCLQIALVLLGLMPFVFFFFCATAMRW